MPKSQRTKKTHVEETKVDDVACDYAHISRANMVGEIASSMAHELNQPLTAILANAQAIKHQIPISCANYGEIIESLCDVIDDAKRAADVIRRLRSLSERRTQHIEYVDINSLIVEAVSMLQSQLIMNQVQVELELEPAFLKVSCDPSQMQQVLFNLLTNAIDASEQLDAVDRRVSICTRRLRSNAIEISVKDRGAGFGNVSYQKLVQPFFTSKENRMGMGLAVSKSILDNVGGRLWAKNNQDAGANFLITLPMPEMSDALPTTKQAPVTEPGFHHDATVFIIDDDVSIRKALARVIRSAGYESEFFPTAERFLQREEYVGAGCIVVDLHLPGASGLDLQRDIEARECNLPMIFITGGGDATSSVLAMKRGAQDFLSKPVDEEQLLSAIATATEKSRVIWEQHEELTAAREKIAKLTPREIEIMKLIVKGSRNKQIAGMLGISEKTVKVHRGNVMKKFDARTVTDLVHVAETAAVNAETSA